MADYWCIRTSSSGYCKQGGTWSWYFSSSADNYWGFAFCIGNISGAALGLNVLFGINTKIGAVISCGVGIILFSSKEVGKAMDFLQRSLGVGTMALVTYVALRTHPPVGETILRTVSPTKVTFLPF